MSGARRRARLATLAAMPIAVLAVASCRQLLGIDDDPPLLGTGGSGGGPDAGGGHDAGPSPFSIVHAVPEGETLYGIWGTGPEFFVAVGTSKLALFSHNGVLTRIGGNEKGRNYLAVSGTDANHIYAAGDTTEGTGFIDFFDGTGWMNSFETPVPLLGIWAVPDGSAVIACGAAGHLYGYHAEKWSTFDVLGRGPNDPIGNDEPRLWAIGGRSLDDFSIAAQSRLYHYEPDSGVLAYYEIQTETEKDTLFRSLWQGPDPETSIYLGSNYFGLSWFSAKGTDAGGYPLTVISRDHATPGAKTGYLQGVWGSESKVIGVGDYGRIVVYDAGMASVGDVPSPTDEPLAAVWGSSVDDVWIVGRREIILHGSLR